MTELENSSVSTLLEGVELDSSKGLVQQIYSVLMDLIVNIRLKPGQSMSEKEISEALKASKTPVREALIRLEDTGLIQVVPKSGTYVSPISLDRYIEACFVRMQLEIGAVRRSAGRNNALRDVLKLETIVTRQIKALDDGEDQLFFQYDEALHRAFFEMAGVPGVWQMVKKSQSDVYRIRHLKRLYNIRRGQQVIQEHQEIVSAIRAGDPDGAEVALVNHIGSLESEISVLSAHPELLDYIDTLNASSKRIRHA